MTRLFLHSPLSHAETNLYWPSRKVASRCSYHLPCRLVGYPPHGHKTTRYRRKTGDMFRCVYVWEERGPNSEAAGNSLAIERWTDSIRWGPSRVRDEFLFYHEKDSNHGIDMDLSSDSDTAFGSRPRPSNSRGFLRDNLVKQTYSVFVETARGRRKWHLIAYFTNESLDYLRSIDDVPPLANLRVEKGLYKSARSAKGRPRDSMPSPEHTHMPPPSPPKSHPLPLSQTSTSANGHRQQHLPTGKGGPQQLPHLHMANSGQGLHRLSLGSQAQEPSNLAPLAYLQNIPPLRRHPLDERALMSLNSRAGVARS